MQGREARVDGWSVGVQSRNALNGLSQCRVQVDAGVISGPQVEVAMPSMVFRNAGAGSRLSDVDRSHAEVAMPSMVFRNAGTDATSHDATVDTRSRNALNGLSQCRDWSPTGSPGHSRCKSQCPQWSFAMQAERCRADVGSQCAEVAMPSMVFRNAGETADGPAVACHSRRSQCPQWSFAMQGRRTWRPDADVSREVAMPSMVFRNAGVHPAMSLKK